ncbi:MAG: CYTH domain-containing protein [Patescibacteria group bacterium]
MFEVEKNFNLTPEEKRCLLEGAEFVGEKTFTDVYLDALTNDLTKRDIWLRKRGERFELKLPVESAEKGCSRKTKHYLEIETDDEIRRELLLPLEGTMEKAIELAGYSPFCICITTRASYVKRGFNIVIDHVTYEGSDWSYDTSEIELLVSTAEEISQAEEKIVEFAAEHGLKSGTAPGKVIEYLRRDRPEHYRALVESGVIL